MLVGDGVVQGGDGVAHWGYGVDHWGHVVWLIGCRCGGSSAGDVVAH